MSYLSKERNQAYKLQSKRQNGKHQAQSTINETRRFGNSAETLTNVALMSLVNVYLEKQPVSVSGSKDYNCQSPVQPHSNTTQYTPIRKVTEEAYEIKSFETMLTDQRRPSRDLQHQRLIQADRLSLSNSNLRNQASSKIGNPNNNLTDMFVALRKSPPKQRDTKHTCERPHQQNKLTQQLLILQFKLRQLKKKKCELNEKIQHSTKEKQNHLQQPNNICLSSIQPQYASIQSEKMDSKYIAVIRLMQSELALLIQRKDQLTRQLADNQIGLQKLTNRSVAKELYGKHRHSSSEPQVQKLRDQLAIITEELYNASQKAKPEVHVYADIVLEYDRVHSVIRQPPVSISPTTQLNSKIKFIVLILAVLFSLIYLNRYM